MFATLKNRVNAAVMAKLADAVATINAVEIDVIFDNEYEVADSGFSGFAAVSPAIHCSASDVSAVVVGTAVSVDGTAYEVADIQPDGDGGITLVLKK